MKISVDKDGNLLLEEVYNPIVLKSKDGEEISICMRDTGFEITYDGVRYDFKEGVAQSYSSNVRKV